MTKAQERQAVFAFGVVFVTAVLALAIFFPTPKPFQYWVFKIVLALAAGGVAGFIPGFIDVNLSDWLKAGGALAVFVLVLWWSPVSLVVPEPLITVNTDPDTIGMMQDTYKAVTYRFKGDDDSNITIDHQDVKWLAFDGTVIESSVGNRILGGSFVLKAKQTHDLQDNIWLPRAMVNKLQERGEQRVKLETIFHGKSNKDDEVIARAILTINTP